MILRSTKTILFFFILSTIGYFSVLFMKGCLQEEIEKAQEGSYETVEINWHGRWPKEKK